MSALTPSELAPFLARRVLGLGQDGGGAARVDQIARHVAGIDLARLVIDRAERDVRRRRRRRLIAAVGAVGVVGGLAIGVAVHRRRRRRRRAEAEPTPLRVA